MKIEHKRPPNYLEIIKHFPTVANKQGVIFTYGDILYAPNVHSISHDLMKHEETHQRQQEKMGKDIWWDRYFNEPEFRLSQELEAYRNQYKYTQINYGRKLRREVLKNISKDLSSSIYGNLITKVKATQLIKEQ